MPPNSTFDFSQLPATAQRHVDSATSEQPVSIDSAATPNYLPTLTRSIADELDKILNRLEQQLYRITFGSLSTSGISRNDTLTHSRSAATEDRAGPTSTAFATLTERGAENSIRTTDSSHPQATQQVNYALNQLQRDIAEVQRIRSQYLQVKQRVHEDVQHIRESIRSLDTYIHSHESSIVPGGGTSLVSRNSTQNNVFVSDGWQRLTQSGAITWREALRQDFGEEFDDEDADEETRSEFENRSESSEEWEDYPEAYDPNSLVRARPACKSDIEAIDKKSYQWFVKAKEAVLDSTCSICMDKFGKGENIAALSCAHFFHQSCLEPWLSQFGECPLCRKRLAGQEKASDASSEQT